MFTVNIKIDGENYKKIAFAKPLDIKKILKENIENKEKIIACKINNKFVNYKTVINSETILEGISRYTTAGDAIYKNTSIFILCKAFSSIFENDNKLVIEHSIGDGIYAEIIDYTFSEKEINQISQEMQNIIDGEMPIEKVEVTSSEAEEIITKQNRDDILKHISHNTIKLHKCGDFYDYLIGQTADNTNKIQSFEIVYHAPGLILRFPNKHSNKINGEFKLSRKLFATHQEHDKWLSILGVHFVNAINIAVKNYKITDLIQVEEALHEKKIIDIAKHIARKDDTKLVLIAGPSSSGKTSFAKRLSIHLRVNGIRPYILGMDDYFLPRNLTPKKENGDFDFENINSLDLELLNSDLQKLLNGKEIKLPKYNFRQGIRESSHKKMQLKENEILIMEGIHGLNDVLSSSVPFNQKLRIYVSALNNLNIDAHNRIPTTDSRKMRRLVRDYNYRGHSGEQTFEMWDAVREGENKNIFPFQENADFMFNSILTYELGVLKKYILPILHSITEYSPHYSEALRLWKIVEHIYNIPDDIVPNNSILREFIGGSIFNY
ncbi:MAG: nucleoside kinase [Candidatus Cloacimonadota bacterium]|nr:nucleoside kinase [Candidatus Cloacimonadota bacterium]